MQRLANPELDRLILDHLAEKYKLREYRDKDEIHLSSLVYCITKAFWEANAPTEPTDEELMLFALGYALQEVLTPSTANENLYTKDGVIYRPDFQIELASLTVELKTTRASLKKNKESLPETWVEYIMGGCYILGINEYHLSSLHLMGSYAPPFPQIYSEMLVFEPEELFENWERLMSRKEALTSAFESNTPPLPFHWCKDWECSKCRYGLLCDVTKAESHA